MATTTTVLGLIKPSGNDRFDLSQHLNDNWDKLDVAVGTEVSTIVSLTDGDATPDVSAGKRFKTANTVATTITNFDGGSLGQLIMILFDDNNTKIQENANIKMQDGLDFDAVQYDSIWFIKWSATLWVEVGRHLITLL